jgi:pyruvate formate lyase activating enzyme
MKKQALYFTKLNNNKVQCTLCPHNCIIAENNSGICGVRTNKQGILYSEIYGLCSSCALDPIEKKPLYEFYPKTKILSLGTKSCNFSCLFCQNWEIAQEYKNIVLKEISPKQAVELAIKYNSVGIAYTYNEPTIWYEYVLDTSKLAQKNNLKNILVTNGYINQEPLKQLLPYIDAMNIDIKSMSEDFYKKYCNATLEPVLQTAKLAKQSTHIEITNLIIPTLNDKKQDFEQLGLWIKENLGKDTPLHISRYFPCYKLEISPTPIETLNMARDILLNYIDKVFIGNV